jgi:hypothetical protein
LGKVIYNLNPPGIDEIDMGTIQMHGFLLQKIRAAFTIQESGPLIRDLSFELDEHVASAFLNFCNLEHHLCRSFYVRLMTGYSATVMPGYADCRKDIVSN